MSIAVITWLSLSQIKYVKCVARKTGSGFRMTPAGSSTFHTANVIDIKSEVNLNGIAHVIETGL